jgi:hypothetical protein
LWKVNLYCCFQIEVVFDDVGQFRTLVFRWFHWPFCITFWFIEFPPLWFGQFGWAPQWFPSFCSCRP